MTDDGTHWETAGLPPPPVLLHIGTVDEFIAAVFGPRKQLPDGSLPAIPTGVTLGVEKFRRAGSKVYCLIWAGRGRACLASENPTEYTTKTAAIEAGLRLAGRLSVTFDARTR